MKIAFLTVYFPPIAGGEGNNAYFLAKELAKKHEVHVFTSKKRGKVKLKEEEKLDGINIHRYNYLLHFGYHFIFSPKLIKDLIKNEFDIIHFFSFGILQNDLILLKEVKKNKSVLINTPAHPSFSFNYNFPKKIIVWLVKNFEKKVVTPKYDRVIAISKGQNKWMVDWGVTNNKIILIPCGITKTQSEKRNGKIIKKQMGLEKNRLIGYLGRIQEYKGVDQLVEALPEIKVKFPNIKLILIGDGEEYKKKLFEKAKKLKVKDDIIFEGQVDENKKMELLSMLDLFILPSKIEGFGIVMLEAMSQGIPIISTKTDGGKFLIKEGSNGFLYNFGNKKALIRRVLEILKNEKLRKKIGNNNIKKSKDFFWDKQAKKLEKLYIHELNNKKIKND